MSPELGISSFVVTNSKARCALGISALGRTEAQGLKISGQLGLYGKVQYQNETERKGGREVGRKRRRERQRERIAWSDNFLNIFITFWF